MTASVDDSMLDAVERLFKDLAANAPDNKLPHADDSFKAAWSRIEEMGLPALLVPESDGGFGLSWRDLQAVLHKAAVHALPLPIGETIVVHALSRRMGLEVLAGPSSIAPIGVGVLFGDGSSDCGRFSGELREVPWGRVARHILLELPRSAAPHLLAVVDAARASNISQSTNIAGEPRDSLVFGDAPIALVQFETHGLFALGALLRAAQIGGALECAFELSVRHVRERKQFGRPLADFQAVQHQLAVFAEEVAAVHCGAMAAAAGIDLGEAEFEIAAAKLRANLAVGRGTSIAHQCHGAIGMSLEHPLQRSTRRLWSWRGEFGNDGHWARWLGERVQKYCDDGLWPMLTELD